MKFIDRQEELQRLNNLMLRRGPGLAIVYGRRRIGKTRLLLEWIRGHKGLYMVADQSSAEVQRRYLADAASVPLPGFGDVRYPDWGAFFARLAREARQGRWRGPLVIDELPYLVTSSLELLSILQRWVDHGAREARLVLALSGSGQRMMQGLVLSADAPLYGRAREILHVGPLEPRFIPEAFRTRNARGLVECYAAWGGVPRYWELAAETAGTTRSRFDRLVLDPLGPLHLEPDRLLIEEHPTAVEVRPVLDAIGMGANRVSEIAGRVGHRATSLARPLDRIVGMGLVKREVPFGEPERKSRRSLYRIADPFVRLWFRVVASNRAFLATASRSERMKLLKRFWTEHVSFVWEEICRTHTTNLAGGWGPASRWWHGEAPEWDIVAEDALRKRLLLGEAKWSDQALDKRSLVSAAESLRKKPPPVLPKRFSRHKQIRALFVPEVAGRAPQQVAEVLIVTAKSLLSASD